jgi:hypothetical protein
MRNFDTLIQNLMIADRILVRGTTNPRWRQKFTAFSGYT